MFTWMNANILLGEKYWVNIDAFSLHTHWCHAWTLTTVGVCYHHKWYNSCSFIGIICHCFKHHYYTSPACTYRSFVITFPLPPVARFRIFLSLKDLQLIFIGTSKNKIDNVNINRNHTHQITYRLIYAFFTELCSNIRRQSLN